MARITSQQMDPRSRRRTGPRTLFNMKAAKGVRAVHDGCSIYGGWPKGESTLFAKGATGGEELVKGRRGRADYFGD